MASAATVSSRKLAYLGRFYTAYWYIAYVMLCTWLYGVYNVHSTYVSLSNPCSGVTEGHPEMQKKNATTWNRKITISDRFRTSRSEATEKFLKRSWTGQLAKPLNFWWNTLLLFELMTEFYPTLVGYQNSNTKTL
jgi:hypothetical protein